MKITQEQLLQIAKEELRKIVTEGKIKFRKTGKEQFSQAATGTRMGSKDNPCPKPGSGAYGVGKRLFDPNDMSRPNPDEWECNTDIEDKLHDAISSFIAFNSPEKILGRVGDFILNYFKNKTSNKLPIHRYSSNKPLYRGSARKFNAYGFDFLEQVQWNKGVEHSKKIMRFPFSGVYQLRRAVSSFSDSFNSAADFMKTNSDKDCIFMYETNGTTQTANGGFFLDLDGMYNLQDNPDYSMSADGKIQFNDVSNFWHENEVLLIGNGDGDSIAVDYVYINIDHLNRNLNKLKQLNPKLAEKIRSSVGYTKEQVERALASLQRETAKVDNLLDKIIPKYKSGEASIKSIGNILRPLQNRIKLFSQNEDIFVFAGAGDKLKQLMDNMNKAFRLLQNLKNPSKEWSSGKFDPSPGDGNLD